MLKANLRGRQVVSCSARMRRVALLLVVISCLHCLVHVAGFAPALSCARLQVRVVYVCMCACVRASTITLARPLCVYECVYVYDDSCMLCRVRFDCTRCCYESARRMLSHDCFC
jgi:hypothetical protein